MYRVKIVGAAGAAGSMLALNNAVDPASVNLPIGPGNVVGAYVPQKNPPLRLQAIRAYNAQTGSSPSAGLLQIQVRRGGPVVIGSGSSISVIQLNSATVLPSIQGPTPAPTIPPTTPTPLVTAFAGGTMPSSNPTPLVLRDLQRQCGQLLAGSAGGFEQEYADVERAVLYRPMPGEMPWILNGGEGLDIYLPGSPGAFVLTYEIDFEVP